MKIKITGWKDGFNKVQFNRFLRKELGYSIASSKNVVDDILNKNEVNLSFEISENLTSTLEGFCLEYEIQS